MPINADIRAALNRLGGSWPIDPTTGQAYDFGDLWSTALDDVVDNAAAIVVNAAAAAAASADAAVNATAIAALPASGLVYSFGGDMLITTRRMAANGLAQSPAVVGDTPDSQHTVLVASRIAAISWTSIAAGADTLMHFVKDVTSGSVTATLTGTSGVLLAASMVGTLTYAAGERIGILYNSGTVPQDMILDIFMTTD